MIPAIGLMVGCYIVTRCFEIRLQSPSPFARLLATLTIGVTVLALFALIASGTG